MSKEKPQWEFYAESLMFQSPNPSQLPWPDFPDLIKPTAAATKQNCACGSNTIKKEKK